MLFEKNYNILIINYTFLNNSRKISIYLRKFLNRLLIDFQELYKYISD
jgi:hypothetical protein